MPLCLSVDKPKGICACVFLQAETYPLESCRVGAPAPTATLNVKTVTKRAFDGRALHGLKSFVVYFFDNIMFTRRPTARHSPVFSTAERPVCVPYKRKRKGTIPDRLIRQKVGSDSEAL